MAEREWSVASAQSWNGGWRPRAGSCCGRASRRGAWSGQAAVMRWRQSVRVGACVGEQGPVHGPK
jgi:hypothetical protein